MSKIHTYFLTDALWSGLLVASVALQLFNHEEIGNWVFSTSFIIMVVNVTIIMLALVPVSVIADEVNRFFNRRHGVLIMQGILISTLLVSIIAGEFSIYAAGILAIYSIISFSIFVSIKGTSS